MVSDTSELPYTDSTEHLTRDISHDLRTPLAIIRMQSQLLIRLVKRGPYSDGFDRERLIVGLQRIDDAVTTLNQALQRMDVEGADEQSGPTDIH